ncbi:DNA binding protein [Arthrobacter phage Crewmate]|uniref:DNA binding protein n=1 Tax=Arthrobacter phage Crewmate TaxID=2832317 RepID=A0AA48Y3M5_9CAUD|nr:DNA binding protein [Arthrobacter phage Crewmate]UIW13302.1 DNA binding protein [Arthrobacter phage Crewmate]WGH21226.1 DNA binding protein [Arthrobacter phage ObiToo]
MSFNNVLADIFTRNAERRIESAEEERLLIAAAKLGDSEATAALLYAYAPAIRNVVERFTGEGHTATPDDEELHATALLGFAEAIAAFDPEKHLRLSAVVRVVLARVMRDQYPSRDAFTVPARTLTRFYSILRKAEGNVYEAAALAPQYEMSRETFFSVLSAVRDVDTIDGTPSDDEGHADLVNDARPIWDASAAEEDALLVAAAFEAVDDVEERVCRLAYGFESYGDPVPDVEIGHKLGMTRPTVQRRRSSALGKMREALAVA